MKVNCLCLRCGESPESAVHMVWLCKENQLMWRLSPLRVEVDQWQTSFREWCEIFAKRCTAEGSWELTMMFVWQAWNLRNLWVFETKRINPMLACTRTINLLGEYDAASIRDAEPLAHTGLQPDSIAWQPPSPGKVKLNSDAAVTKDGWVGLGMAVRDCERDILMVAGRKPKRGMTVQQVEATTFLFGLRYAKDAGFTSIEAKVDCEGLVALLMGKTKELPATQVVVNDIRCFANSLDYCCFGFRKRSCNKVAHSMAKASLTYEEDLVWMEECPIDVIPLVIADKTHLE